MTRTIGPNHGHSPCLLCNCVVLVSYTARVPAEPNCVRQPGNPSIYVGMRAVYMVASQLRSYAYLELASLQAAAVLHYSRLRVPPLPNNWLAVISDLENPHIRVFRPFRCART